MWKWKRTGVGAIVIWREGIGCEDTNLGAFLVLSNGDYVIKDQQSAARMHILAYFYIISWKGRLGSKRIFKEQGCRTSSRVRRHLPVWIFFSSVGFFLSQQVSSLSFFWVKVRADFGKLLRSLPTNPVRLLSAHFNLWPLSVQTCSFSSRVWIAGFCIEAYIFKWLIILISYFDICIFL